MVTRKSVPFLVICLFLILVSGFGGALAATGLLGSGNDVPPSGTAFAETTEAIASVFQWVYRGIAGWVTAIVTSPAFSIAAPMIIGTLVMVFVVIQIGSLIAGAAESTIKKPRHATSRQRAYVGNVVKID